MIGPKPRDPLRASVPMGDDESSKALSRNGRESASAADAPVSCASCEACCCRLEVRLMGDDDVPQALTRVDAFGVTVMRRLDDGWCAALDRDTMRCTIYARRPVLCREYPEGGDDCLVERSKSRMARALLRGR